MAGVRRSLVKRAAEAMETEFRHVSSCTPSKTAGAPPLSAPTAAAAAAFLRGLLLLPLLSLQLVLLVASGGCGLACVYGSV